MRTHMELTSINVSIVVWHLPPNIARGVARFPRSLKKLLRNTTG